MKTPWLKRPREELPRVNPLGSTIRSPLGYPRRVSSGCTKKCFCDKGAICLKAHLPDRISFAYAG